MAKRKKYYKIDNLLKTDAEYMLLYGMRANGKSYQVKWTVLSDAYQNGSTFVYLRRWKEDIKQHYVESYFDDMPVEKITEGVYNSVIAYQGYLYFGNVDEEGKVVKGRRIGRYCALSESTRYKSTTFVGVRYLIYEEMITEATYLADEPTKLMQFVSTVARSEKITVFLIGNTMSRVCPYFAEWELRGTLKQKPGTIEVYHMHYGEKTVDIAVEHCENSDMGGRMFFGNAAKQIVSGEWVVKESPRLPGKMDDYDICYSLQVRYQMFLFNIHLLAGKNGEIYTYVYPGKDEKKKGRLVSPDFNDSPKVTAIFNPKSRVEMRIKQCFAENKVCYSDNLTATDFSQVMQNFHFF